MSDNSEDELNCADGVEEIPWILYKNRDEWSDVTPLPQDDGPHPIVAIAYSEKCKHISNIISTLYQILYH